MQCVRDCTSPDLHKRKNFEQPVWQTAQMFVGEMGCSLVIALSALYKRFSPSAAGKDVKYEPVGASSSRTTDGRSSAEEYDNVDDDELQRGIEPPAKPLQPTDAERKPMTGWKVFLLALPATCDIMGTTLMNVGLLFVAASIYQMTRGALVLFVGLFSVIFLRRHLSAYKWFALFVVVFGVAVVGLAGIVEQRGPRVPGVIDSPDSDTVSDKGALSSATTSAAVGSSHDLVHRASRLLVRQISSAASPSTISPTQATHPTSTPPLLTLLGILLIALAQIFTASQFVLEESLMHHFSIPPLTVVSYEGTFGLALTLLFQLLAHLTYGRHPSGRGGYFDARTGWDDMTTHRSVAVSSLLIMVSIGGFNYFGLSVTRSVSATSRSTIDTCRTLFIWVVSLGLGWETFKWLQVVGFAGLVYGTFLFNEIVGPPTWGWLRRMGSGRRPSKRARREADEGEDRELLSERPVEHT